jgi:hypothetical protein
MNLDRRESLEKGDGLGRVDDGDAGGCDGVAAVGENLKGCGSMRIICARMDTEPNYQSRAVRQHVALISPAHTAELAQVIGTERLSEV